MSGLAGWRGFFGGSGVIERVGDDFGEVVRRRPGLDNAAMGPKLVSLGDLWGVFHVGED